MLDKVERWVQKAQGESDEFDKFISYSIAFNILYNMYAKRINPSLDLSRGDNNRAIEIINLITDKKIFVKTLPSLCEYMNMIPVSKEEYWGQRKIPIAASLRRSYNKNDANGILEYLFKWLYKVRCNLVHGEKEYDENKWEAMLKFSNELFDKIIKQLIANYQMF